MKLTTYMNQKLQKSLLTKFLLLMILLVQSSLEKLVNIKLYPVFTSKQKLKVGFEKTFHNDPELYVKIDI